MDALSYFAIILVLGILAQWASWRAKIPSILLLLAFGFGLSIVTNVKIDDFIGEETLLPLVGIFVSIIMFEGGMTLKFSDLKEAGTPVLRMCTLTVVIGFVLTSALMYYVLGFDWRIAALVGAILTVTGPTVVAPILRVVQPSKKISSIVKWEGIVVDPIGAILAVLVFEFALLGWDAEAKHEYLIIGAKLLGAGVIFPIVLAKGVLWLLKRHLIPDFLHSVFLLAVVAGTFAAANKLQHESGLLTVTVLGMALANQKAVSVRHIIEFKENLQVLIISLLFIMLSGRIDLESMKNVLWPGLILLAGLILVIRPLSIFGAMIFSKKVNMRERLFLSFLAPRGIVAAAVVSVFALNFEQAANDGKLPQQVAEQSQQLVPLIFLCIIGTVLVYGLMALPLAKKLGVTSGRSDGILFAGADNWIVEVSQALVKDGHNVLLMDTKYEKITEAKMAGVPAIHANILSEYAEHEVDLGGIGQLIAATPNDEINSLASIEYMHTFGRKHVWQVTPDDKHKHHSRAVSDHKRARLCFSDSITYQEITKMFAEPHTLKTTTINDVFTLEDFYAEYGDEVVILFMADQKSGLRPASNECRKELKKVSEPTTLYAIIKGEEKLKVKPKKEDLTETEEIIA
ncbi:cation:proton antiporter [Akkermansiaceae bacterium]|nr:cation:proton antiporter [Akkermansiaceae bacterium]